MNSLRRSAPLTRDSEADVAIVGGGIAGLTAAVLLAREGRRVIVLPTAPNAPWTQEYQNFTGGGYFYLDNKDRIVVATKTDQSQPAHIRLRVRDASGNQTECDPVLTEEVRSAGRPESQSVFTTNFFETSASTPTARPPA